MGNLEEQIQKAVLVEQLVQTEGWKVLMELVSGLLDREYKALASATLDHSYYKKIGFLQSITYFKDIAEIIKDKKVREALLTQGRILGFQTAQKLPQYFFDGRQAAMGEMTRQFRGENSDLQLKEKAKFFEDNLKS